MNVDKQMSELQRLHENQLTILRKKRSDYSNDTDILKNFKEVSEICRLLNIDSRTQYGTHLFYIVLKLQRLCNLLSTGKEVMNESIEDNLLDMINYIFLLQCGIKDKE